MASPRVLVEQPLIKAQAKDYVRQTQERLIGAPILQRLSARARRSRSRAYGCWRCLTAGAVGRRRSRAMGRATWSTCCGCCGATCAAWTSPRLALRQAYLQGVDAQDASLAGAHLAEAVLAEAFEYPTAVALSADGALLAAGTPTGEVCLWRVADRTLLLAVQGHTGVVWGVAVSATGGWWPAAATTERCGCGRRRAGSRWQPCRATPARSGAWR